CEVILVTRLFLKFSGFDICTCVRCKCTLATNARCSTSGYFKIESGHATACPLSNIYSLLSVLLLIFCNTLASMLQCGMCRRKTCYRYTERRAGNIVVADHVTPLDGVGVTAVFTADAHFEIWTGLAALRDSHLHQLTNATPIQCLEWIL